MSRKKDLVAAFILSSVIHLLLLSHTVDMDGRKREEVKILFEIERAEPAKKEVAEKSRATRPHTLEERARKDLPNHPHPARTATSLTTSRSAAPLPPSPAKAHSLVRTPPPRLPSTASEARARGPSSLKETRKALYPYRAARGHTPLRRGMASHLPGPVGLRGPDLLKASFREGRAYLPLPERGSNPSPSGIRASPKTLPGDTAPLPRRPVETRFSMRRFKFMVLSRIERAKQYPEAARRIGLEGVVVVAFTILPDGAVEGVEILNPGDCHRILERAAAEAVTKGAPYLPLPAYVKERGGIRMKVRISFKLSRGGVS